MAFRDVANGVGYNEVLTHLNGMGYRTRLGNLFTKSNLYEMLRNEKYNGIYVFNRTASKNESGRRNNHKNKPVEDMIRIPGGMPCIVDEETFERVQAHADAQKRQRDLSVGRQAVLRVVRPPLCGQPPVLRPEQELAGDLPPRPPP